MGWASFSPTSPYARADGGVRGSIDKSAEGDGCLRKEYAQAAGNMSCDGRSRNFFEF